MDADQIESLVVAKKGGLPVCPCMPGCTKDHKHMFVYDYTKNYRNQIDQRPGEYLEVNWKIVNDAMEKERQEKARASFFDRTMMTMRSVLGQKRRNQFGVCEFGNLQTPINLETSQDVSSFQDDKFEFKYENIDPKTQLKYKEAGE